MLETFPDVVADLAELLLVDDRADVSLLVERISDAESGGLRGQALQEAVVDAAVQEQAGACRAGLALSREPHRRNDTVHNPVLVGVRVDDRRALASQLKRDPVSSAASQPP